MKFKKLIMISVLDILSIVQCFKIIKLNFLKKVIRISVLDSSNIV
jgi:hypothetical protein